MVGDPYATGRADGHRYGYEKGYIYGWNAAIRELNLHGYNIPDKYRKEEVKKTHEAK